MNRRLTLLTCAWVALAAGAGLPSLSAQAPDWDARYRAIPEAARIGTYMSVLAARPHHLGSPYGRQNAEWILARFTEWGWDARLETYDVLFPTPLERLVQLTAPTRFTATLEEPALAVDPTTGQKSEQLPGYNAYSVDGDVTGPLVYVNYGRPDDYEELERRGISVKGAIVIARYGQAFRGIKPKVAAEHGAIGCLIYSDPGDDGYAVDDVFPAGPMRNKDGVQRGSVIDLPWAPGDPLTPGFASTAGAVRIDPKDARTLTRIPVLPISYGDAQPLLAALGGPVVPPTWRGGLPLAYHFGPGQARVHLKATFEWRQARVYNVVARLAGSVYPDEWIVRGNHHDAWVNGAQDPVSGVSAVLEEARALGELVRQGWRPKRSIVYAAWDGEEQGLLGSTEWVEEHEAELREKVVVYINSDSNGRGFLSAGGSHALEPFVNGVASAVQDPETKDTVWKRLQARRITTGSPAARAEARSRPSLRLDALGSGSDYSAFLQHAGIPTLNLEFTGLDSSAGIYHSIYDDLYHFTTFLDRDFAYGRALAQTVGTAVVRLADADLLPFDFSSLAETAQTYVRELQALHRATQDEIRERNRQVQEGSLAAAADPRRPVVLPPMTPLAPALNFAPLENAAQALAQAADAYGAAVAAWRHFSPNAAGNTTRLRTVNARLRQSERALTDEGGLPRRPWYRHLLYAPGFYTGYAVKTMPGPREAIEQHAWTEADAEIVRVARALEREAVLVAAAAADLQQAAR
jgi:N-acetylated-alpha-linked acidic dipeptidase